MMFLITAHDMLLTLSIGLFAMGTISFVAGVFILVTKVMNKDIQTIAKQTAKLAQKGITEDISGIVGNASALVDALNQMVKTATGIAAFLIIIGIMMILAAYMVALKL
jgi:hypothetical protein